MKALARLQRIRVSQEKAAERDLIAARTAAEKAAGRLADMEQHEAVARGEMLRGIMDGDPECVYLSRLAHTGALAARPFLNKNALEAEAVCRQVEAMYFATRRDRAAVEQLARDAAESRRAKTENDEQKALDEIYRMMRGEDETTAFSIAGLLSSGK